MTKRYWISGAFTGLVILSFAITASGLAGCAVPGLAGSAVKADVVQSDKPRLPAPSLDEARMPELIEGNAEFALDLYRVLSNQEENLFYSPYSLSVALAMTYAGARGETERQMAETLHYTLPQAQLHPAFNALDQALASRGEGEDEGLTGPSAELRTGLSPAHGQCHLAPAGLPLPGRFPGYPG